MWRLYPRGELRQAAAVCGQMSRLSVSTRRDYEKMDKPSPEAEAEKWRGLQPCPPPTGLREFALKRAAMSRAEKGVENARRF